jgi:hypothetical protein
MRRDAMKRTLAVDAASVAEGADEFRTNAFGKCVSTHAQADDEEPAPVA